jgi:glycosyltransferase involved in cell wall biosynthesis
MRILHIIHQFMPEKVGGTELYAQTLARFQVAQGHSVALFTPSSRSDGLTMVPEAGVRVYRAGVGERSATAVFRATFRHPQLAQLFAQTLAEETPDAIHIQHLMGLPTHLVHQFAGKIPYLVTLHDYWHLCANAQLLTNYDQTPCGGPRLWLNCGRCAVARAGLPLAGLPLVPALAPLLGYRQRQLRQLLDQAALLLAPTHFLRQQHVQMGIPAAKIQVVPNGIVIPHHIPPHVPDATKLRLVYVGGIAWQKGVHVLVEAVNQLQGEPVTLTIYGDLTTFPNYAAELQAQASHPRIVFNGRLPHEQLYHALAQADAIVVPSLWYENDPLTIQEAFAAHVPVIASNHGALPERVQSEINGRLFPPGDSTALSQLLRQLAHDPAQLTHLRHTMPPPHTIHHHLQTMEQLYQQLT